MVSACGGGFQPLYGATAGGQSLPDVMAEIEISPIPGRVGQRIRNDLIFRSTGGGYAPPPRYRLEVAIREQVQAILVEIDGDAKGQVYNLTAQARLVDIQSNEVVFKTTSRSRAAFQDFKSIYANVRARRDAENRAAQEVARSLQTQLAAHLSRSA